MRGRPPLSAALTSAGQSVRLEAELIVILGSRRTGEHLIEAPKASGGQPYQRRSTSDSGSRVEVATRHELVGYRKKAQRMIALARIPKDDVHAVVAAIPCRGDNPLAYVISSNLQRRHMSDSQRAMSAAKLANLGEGRPKTAQICAVSQDDAAKLLGVSRSAVQRADRRPHCPYGE